MVCRGSLGGRRVWRHACGARSGGAPGAGGRLLGGGRGAPAEHPENTMKSFRSAIAAGCDLTECCDNLAADGRLVVIQDHALERTTNGKGLVRDHTAAELRKLDAGEGEKIPLLQEVVELALGKVGLVIEIKQVPALYPGLEEKLLNMLRQLGALSECAVVSFNHAAIHELRKMEPALQLGILEGARPMHPGRMLREAGADVYSPHWGAADPQVIQEVHAAGGAVGGRAGDGDHAGARWKWGNADSIFSNRPNEIGAALRNWAVV